MSALHNPLSAPNLPIGCKGGNELDAPFASQLGAPDAPIETFQYFNHIPLVTVQVCGHVSGREGPSMAQ